MNVIPVRDKILIKPIEGEQKTKSGIYIPDTAKENTYQGTVIAIGAGGKDIEMPPIKEGDTIIYEKFGGTEIKVNSEKHLLISAKDVLAKIN